MILIREIANWRSILDVLVIAAGLFFLYHTLLRLGTWKIVTGILLAMGLFLAASFLDLKGVEWIYSNVSHVAVIALIVIFQPELRKIFERAASVRRAEKAGQGEKLSQVVAETVLRLAKQKRGAIVVVPGKEPLRQWLSGGHPLDAEPSLPLLCSIFDPNSPGHDGAVVVANGRISMFGVRLPVSQSDRLSEEYGTRHHAAMGLAEQSDALVIVVSEERGQISAFQKGKIRPVDTPEQVVGAIRSHWEETASFPFEMPRGKRRWPVILQMGTSLILAAVFWATLIVAQKEMLEKVLTVPVEYTATASDLVLVGEKATEVRLHLAGPKSDLDGVNPSQMSVKIDLSKAVPGKQTFVITRDNMRLSKAVNLLDVAPSSLTLTLAAIVEQMVAVKPQLVGKLPNSLKIRSIEVKPETIRVMSPVTGTKGQPLTVSTTPIYLGSIHEDTRLFCKIVAPPAVQPVEKRWPDVEVAIAVGP